MEIAPLHIIFMLNINYNACRSQPYVGEQLATYRHGHAHPGRELKWEFWP